MSRVHDLVGVGVGPFNLATAALADEHPAIDSLFLEAKASFTWHPGMMLPGVALQMSPLKDLVTPVDPTSPHSFLNYLVEEGRLYQRLHAGLEGVSRREFEDYMRWVAQRLGNVAFDQPVVAITHDREAFQIHVADEPEPHEAKAVVLGVGQRASVPSCVEGKLGPSAVHSSTIANRELELAERRVTVVGGGQSGAEVLEAILDGHWGTPERVDWVSRRPNFQPLDEVAFTNEYFTPAYVQAFHEASPGRKRELVGEQKLASDGISPADLRRLYRRIYRRRALGEGPPEVRLLPGRELVDFEPGTIHRLTCDHLLSGKRERLTTDVAVFCTGYDYRVPELLDPIADEIAPGEGQPYQLEEDFRVRWDGPESLDLFAVNAGRYSHGIAEPQMSLMAWRGARIVGSVAGEELFDVGDGMELVDWTAAATDATRQPVAPASDPGAPR